MSFSIIVVANVGLAVVLSSTASFGCTVSFPLLFALSRLPHPVLIFEMVLSSSLVVARDGGKGRSLAMDKELGVILENDPLIPLPVKGLGRVYGFGVVEVDDVEVEVDGVP